MSLHHAGLLSVGSIIQRYSHECHPVQLKVLPGSGARSASHKGISLVQAGSRSIFCSCTAGHAQAQQWYDTRKTHWPMSHCLQCKVPAGSLWLVPAFACKAIGVCSTGIGGESSLKPGLSGMCVPRNGSLSIQNSPQEAMSRFQGCSKQLSMFVQEGTGYQPAC